MKPNKPSLFLYFAACILVVIFKFLGLNSYVLYTKSVIIPLIFIYYFITNNYRISFIKALVFLCCFIGDVFNLLNFEISHLGALFSFLMVNLFLLKLSFDDFKRLKFNNIDRFPILISLLCIVIILFSIFSLEFENLMFDLSYYVIYGVVLGMLIFVTILNYLKKPNYAFLNLLFMCMCSMISDIFFIINKFYFNLFIFGFIRVSFQVFSYFFMVSYFIENDKNLKINN